MEEAYVSSWIAKKKKIGANYVEKKKMLLAQFFEKYIPDTFIHVKKSFKYMVQCITIFLCADSLRSLWTRWSSKAVEYVFVFACIWCIGGGFSEKI